MSNLYIISERGPDFWNTADLAEQPKFSELIQGEEKRLCEEEFQERISKLKGKKVLVLIHGLKNFRENLLRTYDRTQHHISQIQLEEPSSFFRTLQKYFHRYTGFFEPKANLAYDAIIGITWPSYTREINYHFAKNNAKKVASKAAEHLKYLQNQIGHLDVAAHSMGNYLLFEALNHPNSNGLKLHHIYSLAAAVPKESLNAGEPYGEVSQKCEQLFTFYSQNDQALYWPYYLAENGRKALGFYGPNLDLTANNITAVDCSDSIGTHSAYLKEPPFYRFLENIHKHSMDVISKDTRDSQLNEQGQLI